MALCLPLQNVKHAVPNCFTCFHDFSSHGPTNTVYYLQPQSQVCSSLKSFSWLQGVFYVLNIIWLEVKCNRKKPFYSLLISLMETSFHLKEVNEVLGLIILLRLCRLCYCGICMPSPSLLFPLASGSPTPVNTFSSLLKSNSAANLLCHQCLFTLTHSSEIISFQAFWWQISPSTNTLVSHKQSICQYWQPALVKEHNKSVIESQAPGKIIVLLYAKNTLRETIENFIWCSFLISIHYLFTAKTTPPAPQDPCEGVCPINAECHVEGTRGICTCIDGYFGNPYKQCQPECVTNSGCPQYLACVNEKCVDPCPGTCGINANCVVTNHNPVCSCPRTMTGDPFESCHESKSVPLLYTEWKMVANILWLLAWSTTLYLVGSM